MIIGVFLTLSFALNGRAFAAEATPVPGAGGVVPPPIVLKDDGVKKPDGAKSGDVSLDTDNPSYLLDIAQVQLNHNFIDRAEPYARRAVALTADGKDLRIKLRTLQILAQILERKNDSAGASEQYAAIIGMAQEPGERIRAMLSAATLKTKSKDFDGAAKLLAAASEAIKGAPDTANLTWMSQDIRRRELELAKQDPPRLELFVKEAQDALEKNPKDIGALERLSEIYSSVKPDVPKALAMQEKLVELRPDAMDALTRLSSLYQQNKQPDKALEITRRLMKSAPKEQQTFYAYQAAMQMFHAGKKEDGLKLIEEAAGPEPKGRDLNLLASAYEQTNDLDKAEKTLRKAAEAKELQPAEKATTQVRIADLSRRRKDYAGAEALLRSVMKDNAGQPNIQNYAKSSLTQLYREQGKEFKE